MRKIKIFATKGKNKATIETDVTNWGDLKVLVEAEGYDLSNLAATENRNRTTLEHKDANLPEGDFTIFLRPVKTKSGLDLPDGDETTRGQLKDIIKEYGTPLKDYLKTIKEGRNWTQLDTPTLRSAIAAYDAGEAEVAGNVADVVQSVVEAATEEVCEEETCAAVAEDLFDEALSAMKEAAADVIEDYDVAKYLAKLEKHKSNFDAAVAKASEEDKKELNELEEEWKEMEGGF